jgi:4-amino-4-deoxy-L-arabinose transferase-like glycosyltransferase
MAVLDLDIGTSAPGAVPAFRLTDADRAFLSAALVALVAVRVLMILWLPVTDTTEARYIEIARKMLVSGDWITPQFDWGVPFWGKPPLHTWLSALGMKLFGVGVFGARIFILAASAGAVAVAYGWVRRNLGRDGALAAVAVMASTILFLGAAAFVMTDMVMVLGTTLSMVAFHECTCGAGSRRLWGHLFFAGLAIGLMAKGPTAVVLTGIPIFLWLLAGNRWRLLGRLPWVSGAALTVALTLPWYIAAEIRTPGFLRYFIIGEHVERFLVPGWNGDLYGSGHLQPKGMIWAYAVGVFLPWTGFAPALLARPRALRDLVRADARGWHSYLALWVLSPLILFTGAANILPAYILPSVPAAAILLVSLWSRLWGGPGAVARVAVAAALGGVVALFLAVALLGHVAPGRLTSKTDLMLVTAAREIDPDMVLTYWGGRSFSGEFYTRGAARSESDPVAIRALAANGRRDAIAAAPQHAARLGDIAGPRFTNRGQYGRWILFVETSDAGDRP